MSHEQRKSLVDLGSFIFALGLFLAFIILNPIRSFVGSLVFSVISSATIAFGVYIIAVGILGTSSQTDEQGPRKEKSE